MVIVPLYTKFAELGMFFVKKMCEHHLINVVWLFEDLFEQLWGIKT